MMFHSANSEFRAHSIDMEVVELAIELNEYYLMNFRIVLEDCIDSKSSEIKVEDIVQMAKKNGASQKAVVEVTGLNKSTISRHFNKQT
jgi:hypothetical protein